MCSGILYSANHLGEQEERLGSWGDCWGCLLGSECTGVLCSDLCLKCRAQSAHSHIPLWWIPAGQMEHKCWSSLTESAGTAKNWTLSPQVFYIYLFIYLDLLHYWCLTLFPHTGASLTASETEQKVYKKLILTSQLIYLDMFSWYDISPIFFQWYLTWNTWKHEGVLLMMLSGVLF